MMDRRIEENLEEHLQGTLTGTARAEFDAALRSAEAPLQQDVAAMAHQSALLRATLSCPEGTAPRAGFYARVMDRIEAERAASFWMALVEPQFFRRLAFASLTLLVLLSFTVWNSARTSEQEQIAGYPAQMMAGPQEDGVVTLPVTVEDREGSRDAILVDLVGHSE